MTRKEEWSGVERYGEELIESERRRGKRRIVERSRRGEEWRG